MRRQEACRRHRRSREDMGLISMMAACRLRQHCKLGEGRRDKELPSVVFVVDLFSRLIALNIVRSTFHLPLGDGGERRSFSFFFSLLEFFFFKTEIPPFRYLDFPQLCDPFSFPIYLLQPGGEE
jgi:hypothetical protein